MTESLGPVAYPLDDKTTELEGVAEMPEDTVYPLDDGPAELAPGDETG